MSLLSAVLFARLLGPYQYGLLSLCLNIISLIVPISILGINTSLAQFIPSAQIKGANEPIRYISTGCIVSLVSTFFIITTFFLTADYMATYIFKDRNLISLFDAAPILVLSSVFINILMNIFRGFENFKIYNLLSIIVSIANLLIPSILIYKFSASAFLVLSGTTMSMVITLLFGIFLLMKNYPIAKPHDIFEGVIAQKLLEFGLPFVPSSILLILMFSIDKFAIGYFMSITDVGYYSIASGIALASSSIVEPINVVFFPIFSRLTAEHDNTSIHSYLHNILSLIIFAIFPFSICIIIFSSPLIIYMYGESYEPAIYPLIILMLGIPFYAVYVTYKGLIASTSKTTIFIKMIGFSCLLNILLNFYLIPLYGLNGAAASTAVAYISLSSFTVYYVNKYHKIHITSLELNKLLTILFILTPIALLLSKIANSFVALICFMALMAIMYLCMLWALKWNLFTQYLNKS
jgi:O-antigen/teichoic acid export membrane protein